MKLTGKNVNMFLHSLNQVMGKIRESKKEYSSKFLFGIEQNRKAVQGFIDKLEKVQPSFSDNYLEERKTVLVKYAEKDEDGNPIWEQKGRQYKFKDGSMEDLDKEISEVNEVYKEEIEENDKKAKEFKDIMESEHDLDLCLIPLSSFPEKIEYQEMVGLSWVTVDNTGEKKEEVTKDAQKDSSKSKVVSLSDEKVKKTQKKRK